MPRLTRLPSITFGWYYVVLRAVENSVIVVGDQDLAMLLSTLRVTLRKKGARLHAACVAADRVHLALQLGESSLSALTGDFQHEYARIFNRTHGRRGSLFRRHHRVLLFQHQRWLVPLVHHIHWSRGIEPAKRDLDGFCWNSDSVYLGIEKREWLTTNVVLRVLARGAYSRQAQLLAYQALRDRPPLPHHVALFEHGCPEDPRLLGDTDFVRNVWRATGSRSPERSLRVRPAESVMPGCVRQFIERFNALCDQRLPRRRSAIWKGFVTYDNVRSRSRRRPLPMVRALIASYLIERAIATRTQTARFIGCGLVQVSARRRQHNMRLFRECFGGLPQELLWPDAGLGETDQTHARDTQHRK